MSFILYLLILVFLAGLYFYTQEGGQEGFQGTNDNSRPTIDKPRCPDLLIQKGSKIQLLNSKLVHVPGVNPIEFDNLEDYTEFLAWQKSQGIVCPVLYLQQSYDTQGNEVYKIRPSITEPQGGLPPAPVVSYTTPVTQPNPNPNILGMKEIIQETNSKSPADEPLLQERPTLLVDATRNDYPYNNNSYPAYDETSYYVGTKTPLDQMDEKAENMLYSPNPMDPNWGGEDYTQSLVDSGYYKNYEVAIKIA
jgi:hypothetical protein